MPVERIDAERPLSKRIQHPKTAELLEQMPVGPFLATESRLLIAGDPTQLRSVGPGQVLAELVAVDAVPHIHLTRNRRQLVDDSRLQTLLRQLSDASTTVTLPASDDSLEMVQCTATGTATDWNEAIARILERHRESERPLILTYTNKLINTVSPRVRSYYLPETRQGPARSGFLPGDRVMHTKNNSRLRVMNGQEGSVEWVYSEHDRSAPRPLSTTGDLLGDDAETAETAETAVLTMRLLDSDPGKPPIYYDAASLTALKHAYVLTVHKAQGSERAVVIAIVPRDAYSRVHKDWGNQHLHETADWPGSLTRPPTRLPHQPKPRRTLTSDTRTRPNRAKNNGSACCLRLPVT